MSLTAENQAWSTTTLVAPAGKTWTLVLRNDGTLEHNFTIEFGSGPFPNIYQTDIVSPGTYRYTISGFPPGTYTFVCTLHPYSMFGTLTLR